MKKEVYIVHCIDTEGPLYESIEGTFEKIYNTFGYRLAPTKENLVKLQNKQIDLGGNEEEVARVVSANQVTTLGSWEEIGRMLERITTDEYREKLKDSDNNGWVFSWFCMDHVGFTGNNPRKRDVGYHNIFDYYKNRYKGEVSRDIIQWHYHPVSFSGEYNACGMNYVAGSNVFEILARKVIDRHFFPCAYRPGFNTERPDSHWLLEQWIPFDYANQSMSREEHITQRDMIRGRFGNWEGAPVEWYPYHPDYNDYRKVGKCNRWITRCLNMNARMRTITKQEVYEAFNQANNGKPALLAFCNHDFRNMESEIDKVRNLIEEVSGEFTEVKFYFVDAITGMRKVLELEPQKVELEMELLQEEKVLHIKSNDCIFGSQPFLCFKTITGQYLWSNLDYGEENEWWYTFDFHSIELDWIEKIGIAANSKDGTSEIIIYDVKKQEKEYYINQ